ncbi:hypothetical protein B0J12DRAFT_777981 [Macrophomina phaseolina]|uniref:Cupin type-2 domain-containing protein n=1 Tax=Macrophomina phaseolina TaxID=35725 RepID=A0ABQ8GG44_9PEZI|nr:hypothetical protein B0J12DRAFT_777981 [Macrophomina phaseolina]
MTAPQPPELTDPLRQPQRFVTTHDKAGKAIYSPAHSTPIQFWQVGPPARPAGFGLGYATSSFPVHLTNDEDLADFAAINEQRQQSGLVKRGGTVLRYVDYSPECESPMHRTVSCDYGIVLEGEMECLLDSGESRILKAGDVAVQRGTAHQWINRSKGWARMLYVLLDATPVEVNGAELGEDLGGMIGVPQSE